MESKLKKGDKPVKDFKYKRKPKPVKVKKYEPKVGEWYKMTGWDYGKGIFCPTGFINSLELKRFGFTYNEGEFITISKTLIPTTCYKADQKEVLFALTREAEKRGYKDGVMVKSTNSKKIGVLSHATSQFNSWDKNGFYFNGHYILNTKGEWAEIIPQDNAEIKVDTSLFTTRYKEELEQSKQLVIELQKQLDTATNEMLKAQSELSKMNLEQRDLMMHNSAQKDSIDILKIEIKQLKNAIVNHFTKTNQ